MDDRDELIRALEERAGERAPDPREPKKPNRLFQLIDVVIGWLEPKNETKD